MFKFKAADLESQQAGLDAYTPAPTHYLKSVTASAICFLDRDATRSPSPAEHMDLDGERKAGSDGLRVELDSYLQEPRMDPFKVTSEGSGPGITINWCDPLRYWAVCISSQFWHASTDHLCRVPKKGSHTSFDSQWTSFRHKRLRSPASGSFPQARKHVLLAETASTRISWRHSKHSNFRSVVAPLTLTSPWMMWSTLTK
jgi:hypothetical protein